MKIDVQVSVAKDGSEILEIVKDGQIYPMNSTYKPIAEAERFAKQYTDLEKDSILFVFGFGNGMFADAIKKACPESTIIVFYEPCAVMTEYLKENRNMSVLCDSGNDCIIVADGIVPEDKEGIYSLAEFPKVLQELVLYHNRDRVHYCILPKYKELFSKEYNQYLNTIELHMQRIQSNTQTTKAIGHIAVENNIHILKYLPDSYCADSFVNLFPENMPAILVSAGPSLEKNIGYLKQAKGRALIVCVDTAVRYMLKENILPDMIVTIDPRKELSLFDDERIREIPLVGVTDMNRKVLEQVQSRMLILAGSQNPYIQRLYAEEGHVLGELEGGGSVATTAYTFCRYLGFKRLILVGQDLALTDNQMYAGRQKLSMETFNRELIEVEDVYGEKVYTTRDYYFYLKWFEQRIAIYPELQVVDATEGGARINGTIIMPLQKAINDYAKEEYDITSIIADVAPVYRKECRVDIVDRILKDKKIYGDIICKLEYGVSLAKKGIQMALDGVSQEDQKYRQISKEMLDICNMYESSDANFLIQREIDATDLDNYMSLCAKEQASSYQEQYKLMLQYFECILQAAKSVNCIYDELQF